MKNKIFRIGVVSTTYGNMYVEAIDATQAESRALELIGNGVGATKWEPQVWGDTKITNSEEITEPDDEEMIQADNNNEDIQEIIAQNGEDLV